MFCVEGHSQVDVVATLPIRSVLHSIALLQVFASIKEYCCVLS